MANEDVDALNAGLNAPTDDDDGYGQEPETEASDDDGEVETKAEDSGGDEVKTEADEVDDDEEVKPLTRSQQRIQTLANERKLAEQRAELLERQLAEIRQQQPQRQQEDEDLTPLEKWQRDADRTIKQVQLQNMDMQDRSDFVMQVSKNPAEAAYLDRVEQTLAEARKSGFNPRREDVLIRLMGIDARNKMRQAPSVKRDAAKRVTQAQGKPLANKSNVAATKTESSEFDRLKGIIL